MFTLINFFFLFHLALPSYSLLSVLGFACGERSNEQMLLELKNVGFFFFSYLTAQCLNCGMWTLSVA